MKRIRKSLSILLVAMLLLMLMPMTVPATVLAAPPPINAISVSVTEPVVGANPDFNPVIHTPDLSMVEIMWTKAATPTDITVGAGDTFEAGASYRALIRLEQGSVAISPSVTGLFNNTAVTGGDLLYADLTPIGVYVYISKTFTPIVPRVLESITPPAAITGVTNGVAKTAAGIGLPSEVTLVTDAGSEPAVVTWDVLGCAYNPLIRAAQNVTVTGTVTLPAGVVNTKVPSVSLDVSISVSVVADPLHINLVELVVTEPLVWATPVDGTTGTADTIVDSFEWYNGSNGVSMDSTDFFEYGKQYECRFVVQPDSTYVFSSATAVTINGYTATISYQDENRIECKYIFTAGYTSDFNGILPLTGITGVPNGTVKTATDLGLPAMVAIDTSLGHSTAAIVWDVASSTYDPASRAAQSFSVIGTITVPVGMANTLALPLTVTINVSVDAASPILADLHSNTIAVQGGPITAGVDFTFTAAGDRQNEAGVVQGDTRYVPLNWSVNPSGTFTPGGPYTVTTQISSAGSHTITVVYQLQRWDGTAWVDVTGTTDTKTLAITVQAAPVVAAGTAPKTGDDSNLSLWIGLGTLGFAGLVACGVIWYRRRRKTA